MFIKKSTYIYVFSSGIFFSHSKIAWGVKRQTNGTQQKSPSLQHVITRKTWQKKVIPNTKPRRRRWNLLWRGAAVWLAKTRCGRGKRAGRAKLGLYAYCNIIDKFSVFFLMVDNLWCGSDSSVQRVGSDLVAGCGWTMVPVFSSYFHTISMLIWLLVRMCRVF